MWPAGAGLDALAGRASSSRALGLKAWTGSPTAVIRTSRDLDDREQPKPQGPDHGYVLLHDGCDEATSAATQTRQSSVRMRIAHRGVRRGAGPFQRRFPGWHVFVARGALRRRVLPCRRDIPPERCKLLATGPLRSNRCWNRRATGSSRRSRGWRQRRRRRTSSPTAARYGTAVHG